MYLFALVLNRLQMLTISTLDVPFSRTDVFKNSFLFGTVICGTIYLLV